MCKQKQNTKKRKRRVVVLLLLEAVIYLGVFVVCYGDCFVLKREGKRAIVEEIYTRNTGGR